MANMNSSTSFLSAKDALAILNIQSSNLTPEDIKTAYRKATAKYHPDHNPAGLEMMKMVNIAHETLKTIDLSKINNSAPNICNYGDAINNILNAIINLGLNVELCGAWIWISGNTKPRKNKMAEALTLQNSYIYQEVYPTPTTFYHKLKKQLNSFLNSWLNNCIQQGYKFINDKINWRISKCTFVCVTY